MRVARASAFVLALTGLLAWACSEVPTETAVESVEATADAKPPWAGGGGGGGGDDGDGGGGGVTPLVATLGPGSLIDDGNGPYIDEECGVRAEWDVDSSFFDFRPLEWLNKKQQRDIERDPACSEVFPRGASIDLGGAIVRSYCVAPASFDECSAAEETIPAAGTTLSQLAASGIVDAPNPGGDPISTFATRLFDANRDSDPSTAPGGLNTEYCLDDGTGRPLRFDPERNPGSHELLVTTASDGRPTRIESQANGNDVGSCAHTRSDGTLVVLNLELDIAIDLAEAGS